MPKPYRLSPRARANTADIGAWTEDKFGSWQADKYLNQMIADCSAISAGRAPHRSCRGHFRDDLPDDLRFVRSGRHFIIFVETEAEILIVGILHQSSDIRNRLGGIPE